MYDNMQEILLSEADILLLDYSGYTPTTESLATYGVGEKDLEDTDKMVVAINKMKFKRDIKALLRLIEVTILAVVAYKVAMGIVNVLVILAVSAIIWILYRLHKNVVSPMCSSIKGFFKKYSIIANTKKATEENKKKVQNLKQLNDSLVKSMERIDKAEKDIESRKDD